MLYCFSENNKTNIASLIVENIKNLVEKIINKKAGLRSTILLFELTKSWYFMFEFIKSFYNR